MAILEEPDENDQLNEEAKSKHQGINQSSEKKQSQQSPDKPDLGGAGTDQQKHAFQLPQDEPPATNDTKAQNTNA